MKLSLYTFSSIFCIGLICNVIAQNDYQNFSFKNAVTTKPYQVDYSTWDDLLHKHVSDEGFVDYKGFKEDKQKLLEFTKYLEENTPQKNWTKNQKKAYLINAYNAFTIQLVVEHYPIKSIKDIGVFFDNVFKKDFINFNGEMISLDDIEKGMLLPMGDPRVHFAVNCASYSCPKLDNKAYQPKNIDQHLDQVAKSFINSHRNALSPDKIKLSKIFKWYENDFEKENQTVIDFINKYSNITIKSSADIEYLDYNWKLNSQDKA
ncbi:DUF547 domain-containing protein [Flavobacterium sp. CS20]|uniref:DUF547 domain-containing protein n=1 Tax=Flavobacterium sp. CS20 TaxID=2775246 RepID=UPI001B3A6763|nr:DUF547 domain-containing protein [Flavobacterium sp. CS20]QTY26938.1 DUF547 domain-containing protein [Flavobacterium sp. CS20]